MLLGGCIAALRCTLEVGVYVGLGGFGRSFDRLFLTLVLSEEAYPFGIDCLGSPVAYPDLIASDFPLEGWSAL